MFFLCFYVLRIRRTDKCVVDLFNDNFIGLNLLVSYRIARRF